MIVGQLSMDLRPCADLGTDWERINLAIIIVYRLAMWAFSIFFNPPLVVRLYDVLIFKDDAEKEVIEVFLLCLVNQNKVK